METSLVQRAVVGAIWMMSGKVVQAVLRLLVLGVLARALEPSDFGLASAAMVIVAFFQILLRMGVAPAVIQRPDLDESHHRVAFTLAVAIGAATFALVAGLAGPLAIWVFAMPELAPVLAPVALLLPIQGLGIVALALMERRLAFDRIVRIELGAYVFGYAGIGIPLALAGYGVWSLVGAYVAEALLMTIAALALERHSLRPSLDLAIAKNLSFYGAGFSLARVGNYVAGTGDNWVTGRWLGSEALGFYKYAYELTAMLAQLMGGVLDKVLFPAMARIQHDPARLRSAYLRGVALVAAIAGNSTLSNTPPINCASIAVSS